MNTNLPFQTLHGHSVLSDGLMTHEEILDECAKNRIGVVSVTDHDTLIKPEIFEKIKSLNHEVKYVSGIELTADYVPETKIKIPAFHITGLFVDPTNASLVGHCEKLRQVRLDKIDKYVKKLTGLGFSITREEVAAEISDGGAFGRPLLALALGRKQGNRDLLEKLFGELIQKSKTDEIRKKQLEEYNNLPEDRKEKAKWFTMLLGDKAMFSVYIHDPDEDLISLDQTVSLIRQAGGIAIVAHWSFYDKKAFPLNLMEKLIQEKRIDGVETVYVFGEDIFLTPFSQDRLDLVTLCEKYDCVQGGGIDFHTRANLQTMSNPKYLKDAKKTEKMAERIIDRYPNLDLSWTTLSR